MVFPLLCNDLPIYSNLQTFVMLVIITIATLACYNKYTILAVSYSHMCVITVTCPFEIVSDSGNDTASGHNLSTEQNSDNNSSIFSNISSYADVCPATQCIATVDNSTMDHQTSNSPGTDQSGISDTHCNIRVDSPIEEVECNAKSALSLNTIKIPNNKSEYGLH